MSAEIAMLRTELEEIRDTVRTMRSQHINDLLNVKVMLENEEYEEAMDYLTESLGE